MKRLLTVSSVFLLLAVSSAQAAEKPRKIVVAHRGASGYLPEHTLEAVALAYAMGADYLEQDVVLSRDGIPVVLHDIHVDTVTDVGRRFPGRKREDGRYYAIDFTLNELKELKISERFDPATGKPVFGARFPMWHASFEIPTLEEEIQLVQGLNKSTGGDRGIYPEIKAPAWHRAQGRDVTRVVLDLLSRYEYRTKVDKVYLQCFDFAEVKRIRNELGYEGRLIQLIGTGVPGESTDYQQLISKRGLEEVARVADGIGPSLELIVKGRVGGKLQFTDLVKNAHELGLEVHPYTFRADALPPYAASLEELFRIFLVRIGVDGFFTDQPDRGAGFVRSLTGPR
jgi:glycerophosphoryl diester phosphodiesterase